jgi:hypothetical protein
MRTDVRSPLVLTSGRPSLLLVLTKGRGIGGTKRGRCFSTCHPGAFSGSNSYGEPARLGLAILPAGLAYAGSYTFTVINHADSEGEGTCNLETNKCTTLGAAIHFANGLAGTNTVTVTLPAGTFELKKWELAITSPGLTLNLAGAGPEQTIVERSSSASQGRVFDICTPNPAPSQPCFSPGPTANLSGMTVQNGLLRLTTAGRGSEI